MAEVKNNGSAPPQPKMPKIINGTAGVKKKTRKEKFKDAFIAQDFKTAVDYAWWNYAVPSIKNLALSFIFSTITGVFYGNGAPNNTIPPFIGGQKTNTNYVNFFTGAQPQQTNKSSNKIPEYNRVTVSAGEAEMVIAALQTRAQEFDWVPLSAFYDALGITSDYPATQIGWSLEEIMQAKVFPAGLGENGEAKYSFIMARPKPYNSYN